MDQNKLFIQHLTFSLRTFLDSLFDSFALYGSIILFKLYHKTWSLLLLVLAQLLCCDIKGTDTSVSVISENKMTNKKQMSDLII